jgi:hypothetical protein
VLAIRGCNRGAWALAFLKGHFVADEDAQSMWLPVIGKALAYLCLSQAMEREQGKYDDVLAKVKFLQGLGLSRDDAAEAAGSSAQSVRVMHHRKKSGRAKNGTTKKKASRRRQ